MPSTVFDPAALGMSQRSLLSISTDTEREGAWRRPSDPGQLPTQKKRTPLPVSALGRNRRGASWATRYQTFLCTVPAFDGAADDGQGARMDLTGCDRAGARTSRAGAVTALIGACLWAGMVAGDAGAAPRGLVQKPGTAGCISDSGRGPCAVGRGISAPKSVTVSPDGASVYVGSENSASVAVFDRVADGRLTQKPGAAGCISVTGIGPCQAGIGLGTPIGGGPFAVTVSPDGRSVYTAAYMGSAVAVFDRGSDGALTQKPGLSGCISDTGSGPCADGTALSFLRSVTVSPDGANVYVAAESSDAISIFDRAPDGRLTQKPATAACVSDTAASACVDGTALDGAGSVAVSPDGSSVYVASEMSGAVAVFDRAADGSLTQKPGTAGCISDTGAGPCRDGSGLEGARSVTVSPDGSNAYVASSRAVAVFDRAADGTLRQKPGTAGCISDTGAAPCADGRTLFGARAVAVSPDGTDVYVATFLIGGVSVFDRAANGSLTQKPGTAGCISDTGAGACADGTALGDAESVAVSPQGSSAYVASADGVAVFDHATLPTAPPQSPQSRRAQPQCPLSGAQSAGSPGTDALTGDASSNVLFGLAGADHLRGLAGRDCLYGGPGNDSVLGGSGADRLFGGPGDDRLQGEGTKEHTPGTDATTVTRGDRLSGGAGNDRLTDRRGNATLSGGAGADRINARDTSPSSRRRPDTIRCGHGRDLALVDAADRVAADCERVIRTR
jgi:DNA-binding beta-propeller fold protein YncE